MLLWTILYVENTKEKLLQNLLQNSQFRVHNGVYPSRYVYILVSYALTGPTLTPNLFRGYFFRILKKCKAWLVELFLWKYVKMLYPGEQLNIIWLIIQTQQNKNQITFIKSNWFSPRLGRACLGSNQEHIKGVF